MGFDITFHPVSAEELKRFVFDIVTDPNLAMERARQLSQRPERQQALLEVYDQFSDWKQSGEELGATIGLAAAAFAGFLHPFWYARGSMLSQLPLGAAPELKGLFMPLPELAAGALAGWKDTSRGRISANFTASGFIPPNRVAELPALLDRLAATGVVGRTVDDYFDADGRDALLAASRYAIAHGLGLIEASDIVVPIANQCNTEFSNLRAAFLNRMEP